MYILKTSASFDSAHFLAGYAGKCSNLHGHTWKIEAEAGAAALQQSGQERGMVLDFSVLKRAVRALADRYDHALIYEAGTLRPGTVEVLKRENFRLIEVGFRPTAENFARQFFSELKDAGIPVLRVTVSETPENTACYTEGDS